MLFFVIFSLVSLSDPLPTLSSHVENGGSQVAPQSSPRTLMSLTTSSGLNTSEISSWFYFGGYANTMSTLIDDANDKKLSVPITPSHIMQGSRSSVRSTAEKGEDLTGELGDQELSHKQYSMPTMDSGAEQTLGDHFDGKEYPLVLKLDRDYTPMDIAEYIYVTGDEKGFAQGVAEMIEDGEIMVSKDDVIVFLEAVQRELATLRGEEDSFDNGIQGDTGKNNDKV